MPLPSIHEMFPDYKPPTPHPFLHHVLQTPPTELRLPPPLTIPPLHVPPRPPLHPRASNAPAPPACSFDILRSSPSARSLTHVASGAGTTDHRLRPLPRFVPTPAQAQAAKRARAQPPPPPPFVLARGVPTAEFFARGEDEGPTLTDQTATDTRPADCPSIQAERRWWSARERERRHVCDICGKSFSRPSSLVTHGHVHTGHRPFVCPVPSCRRLFSVRSNMRRHLRNHTPTEIHIADPTALPSPDAEEHDVESEDESDE